MTAAQILRMMARRHPDCVVHMPDSDTVSAMIRVIDSDGDTIQYLAEHHTSIDTITLYVSTHLVDTGEGFLDGHVEGAESVYRTLTANSIV